MTTVAQPRTFQPTSEPFKYDALQPSIRPGANDAYRLPSLVGGKRVPSKSAAATPQGGKEPA